MRLDRQGCLQAVRSRDPRFDGRFFTGVVTTGIYCRPICPARTPLSRNVRFFSCAAAAEEAGFRPCRRCRPETAPGTPAWNGTSATIARALRLIGEGAMDEGGVSALAARLGIGDRHLRRLFSDHLGASPHAIARTRRAHFAHRLIVETDMPIAQIAFASGFGSLRRFNALIRGSFKASPTELRAERGAFLPRGVTSWGSPLALRLAFRPPYDHASLLRFLADRAIPGVEEVRDGAYRRTFETSGQAGTIEVRAAAAGEASMLLHLTVPPAADLLRIVERVRRLLDLDADPAAIASDLRKDPILSRAISRRPGLRVPGAWDPFEVAVRAVIGQQISVAGARSLVGRLVRLCGERAPAGSGSLTHLFPTATSIAEADLGSIGLTGARRATLRALAVAARDDPEVLAASGGLEESLVRLTRIPGIGPWTAGYIAMRGFGEPDAIPAGDLGLQRALGVSTAAGIDRLTARWRPWRAYGVIHVWHPAFAVESSQEAAPVGMGQGNATGSTKRAGRDP